MIKIEYLGEKSNGAVCGTCGGSASVPDLKVKKIFNRVWKVGIPQEIPISDFPKYMATGLFKKV
ncbi:hypothetical protein [Enterococcus alishanensis]